MKKKTYRIKSIKNGDQGIEFIISGKSDMYSIEIEFGKAWIRLSRSFGDALAEELIDGVLANKRTVNSPYYGPRTEYISLELPKTIQITV